ncbi:MAG: FAD/NAD(P)-binding protein [Pseudomonadota bacterium]
MSGREAITAPMLPNVVPVLRRFKESADVATLVVGGAGDYAPGQFAMLYAFGVGEAPISVSGPERQGAARFTIRAVGAVTRALCRLKKGARLGLRGPFGQPWPLPLMAGRDVLVIAGGLGLAPLRPLLHALMAQPRDDQRVTLLYGARSPQAVLFSREIARWQARGRIAVHLTVDSATAGWTGAVGVVPQLIARASFDPANTIACLCGPDVMMRFTAKALIDAGLAPSHCFVSLERHMKCAIGHCGRCQLGGVLLCRDGPVLAYDRAAPLMAVREL